MVFVGGPIIKEMEYAQRIISYDIYLSCVSSYKYLKLHEMFTCLFIHEKSKLPILAPRNSINTKVNYFIVKHQYIYICNPIKSLKDKQFFFQNMILAQKQSPIDEVCFAQ